MKNIAFLVLTSFFFFFSSCQKEIDISREILDEYAYLAKFDELRKTKVNGGFLRVQNYHANFAANPSDIVTSITSHISEELFDKVDIIGLNEHEITISDLSIKEVYKEDRHDLFGREITLSTKNSVERNGETYGPYYVPEIIEANIPIENSQKVLRDGSVITWNADPLNEQGVLIIVDYANTENNVRERQVEIEVVPDNGSYTFMRSDFPLIPEKSLVILRVIRGVYDFIDFDNFSGTHEEDFLFIMNTETAGYVKYE
jgi:hypothetical protein